MQICGHQEKFPEFPPETVTFSTQNAVYTGG